MGSDLQQNRYDQLLRRVGGIIGPGSKVAEVLAELFPVIDVENVPGELLLLGQTNICIGSTSLTPDAGRFALIQLFNPVESGKLISVERIDISVSVTQTVSFGMNNAIESGSGFKQFRDARKGLFPLPTGLIGAGSAVGRQVGVGIWRVTGNQPLTIDLPKLAGVLSPGTGMNVGAQTVDTALFATFWWQERIAEASELNF